MKALFLNLFVLTFSLAMMSCSDDDKGGDAPTPPEFTLDFNVETNQDQMGDFSHNKMVVFNGEVWSVGGYNSYSTVLQSDVWKSSNGRNWQSVTSDQFPSRRDHSLTVFDNKLWVIGGSTDSSSGDLEELDDVWYSSDGLTWNLATDDALGVPNIGSHEAVVFNNKLFIIKSGVNEGAAGSTVWSSSDGITWNRDSNNAFPHRVFFSATVFDNDIYVIGGAFGDPFVYYNAIYKSSDGINWIEVSPAAEVFSRRALHKTLTYENKLWVFGGIDESTSTGKGLWFSEDGSQWFRYEPLPAEDGIYSFDALTFDGAIWIFGGMHQEEGTSTITRVGTINTITQI